MPKSTSLMLPQNANNQSVLLQSADTTLAKLCYTAGANDSDVKAIVAITSDTTTVNVQLFVCRGGTDYIIGTVNLPVQAGNLGTVPGIDLLNATAIPGLPLDNVGKRYLPLKTGDTLKVSCQATMTAGKTTYVSVFGQDY
jgi:hypothetical protein